MPMHRVAGKAGDVAVSGGAAWQLRKEATNKGWFTDTFSFPTLTMIRARVFVGKTIKSSTVDACGTRVART